MPSFDIVSEIDQEEVRNATENASRELESRFDFRGVEASIEYNKDDVTLKAETDFQLEQLLDIFRNKLIKRNIDITSCEESEPVHSGKTFSIKVTFKDGIEAPIAKKLVKLIKDNKVKVQAAIQGEKVRITGKKRDDLQAVMALIKSKDLDQPFQFNNFRD